MPYFFHQAHPIFVNVFFLLPLRDSVMWYCMIFGTRQMNITDICPQGADIQSLLLMWKNWPSDKHWRKHSLDGRFPMQPTQLQELESLLRLKITFPALVSPLEWLRTISRTAFTVTKVNCVFPSINQFQRRFGNDVRQLLSNEKNLTRSVTCTKEFYCQPQPCFYRLKVGHLHLEILYWYKDGMPLVLEPISQKHTFQLFRNGSRKQLPRKHWF